MTSQTIVVPAARTARLLYGAMLAGVLLFAVVGPLLLKPGAQPGAGQPLVFRVLLGLSLGASALSLFLRRRVPRRNTDASADLFWSAAIAPALVTWAPLEAAVLLAVIAYTLTHSLSAVAVGAVALALFVTFNPAYLERR